MKFELTILDLNVSSYDNQICGHSCESASSASQQYPSLIEMCKRNAFAKSNIQFKKALNCSQLFE